MLTGFKRKFATPEEKFRRICNETGDVKKLEALINSKQLHYTDFNNLVDSQGYTPQHSCCRKNFVECVKYMIENLDAKVDIANTSNGNFPIHTACLLGFELMLDVLINIGGSDPLLRNKVNFIRTKLMDHCNSFIYFRMYLICILHFRKETPLYLLQLKKDIFILYHILSILQKCHAIQKIIMARLFFM
jgi:hypothetical protein